MVVLCGVAVALSYKVTHQRQRIAAREELLSKIETWQKSYAETGAGIMARRAAKYGTEGESTFLEFRSNFGREIQADPIQTILAAMELISRKFQKPANDAEMSLEPKMRLINNPDYDAGRQILVQVYHFRELAERIRTGQPSGEELEDFKENFEKLNKETDGIWQSLQQGYGR